MSLSGQLTAPNGVSLTPGMPMRTAIKVARVLGVTVLEPGEGNGGWEKSHIIFRHPVFTRDMSFSPSKRDAGKVLVNQLKKIILQLKLRPEGLKPGSIEVPDECATKPDSNGNGNGKDKVIHTCVKEPPTPKAEKPKPITVNDIKLPGPKHHWCVMDVSRFTFFAGKNKGWTRQFDWAQVTDTQAKSKQSRTTALRYEPGKCRYYGKKFDDKWSGNPDNVLVLRVGHAAERVVMKMRSTQGGFISTKQAVNEQKRAERIKRQDDQRRRKREQKKQDYQALREKENATDGIAAGGTGVGGADGNNGNGKKRTPPARTDAAVQPLRSFDDGNGNGRSSLSIADLIANKGLFLSLLTQAIDRGIPDEVKRAIIEIAKTQADVAAGQALLADAINNQAQAWRELAASIQGEQRNGEEEDDQEEGETLHQESEGQAVSRLDRG